MLHYHVISGLSGGYMPDTNDVYRDLADAIAGLAWMVREVADCCDNQVHACYELSWMYAKFAPGHGVEIAEVLECEETDCMADFEAFVVEAPEAREGRGIKMYYVRESTSSAEREFGPFASLGEAQAFLREGEGYQEEMERMGDSPSYLEIVERTGEERETCADEDGLSLR